MSHGDLYDIDDEDHVLVISDWTDVLALQHMMMDLHADGPGEPDSILVNGRGTNKVVFLMCFCLHHSWISYSHV